MLSVALVDALIKDADIVAVFRAVHHLLLGAISNPFLSLPRSFSAAHVKEGGEATGEDGETLERATEGLRIRNEPVLEEDMFAAGPGDIKPEWLKESRKFTRGIERLGELLRPSSGPVGRSSGVGVRVA